MSSGPGTDAPVRLLVVLVGGRRFGVPLGDVLGIQARVPDAAVAQFRGGAIPIVEAWSLLGAAEPGAGGGAGELVIVAGAAGERALAVDRVAGFVDAAEVRELPELVAPFAGSALRGIALQPEGELLIVDAAALADTGAGRRGGRGA